MIIIYIDIILLIILLLLVLYTCGYCAYRIHRLQRSGQVAILLRPTKVLFSHKKEGETDEQLRTVVAYQNPFTGDYCVRASRTRGGYVNATPPTPPARAPLSPRSSHSTDSGLSDAYEPVDLVPRPQPRTEGAPGTASDQIPEPVKAPMTPIYDNSVNKTWKWDYTEYQI